MKAFYCESYGGPEVMRYGDLPDPLPGKEQVLVAVKASSVNPVDWKIRQGGLKFVTGRRFPKVLGTDVAGVVKAVGANVTAFKPGDPVYGTCVIFLGKQGGQAELVAVEPKQLGRMPEGLSFEDAAALPTAALTASNGLRQCGPLERKQVLVNGATGGVGHFAVQMAKARGATVTAVCSARNAEVARSLGAEHVIDYAQEDFTRSDKRYDVIYDAHGMLGLSKVAPVLSASGFYLTTLPRPSSFFQSVWSRVTGGRQVIISNMRGEPEDYAELNEWVKAGTVKPLVEKVFPLSKAAEAYALAESGKGRGKIVLRMD